MEWLRQAVLPGQDNRLLTAELELLEILKRKISESNGIVKELARGDKRVKLLRSIPGKVFHGRITKLGNKWLRWAFIEAVQPAISCDADLFTYYQRLKMKKGANAAKVAIARRLLTIVYRVLRQERLYERRNRRVTRNLALAALVTP